MFSIQNTNFYFEATALTWTCPLELLHHRLEVHDDELYRPMRLSLPRRQVRMRESSAIGSRAGQARSGQGHLTNVLHPHANVALFQYTGVLPMTLDFVFTGSLSRQGKVCYSLYHPGLFPLCGLLIL